MKSKSFGDIKVVNENNIMTGNQTFDKWFSKDGGIVPGSIIFVTGTSGAGKTTLMINLMNWLQDYKSSFYSREMSIGSLKQQVKDYNFKNNNAYFVDDEDCPHLNDYFVELETIKPEFVIVDSLQAIASIDFPEMSEEKASVIVRQKLEQWCKANGSTLFLIGHNTKDNEFAGKNTNMQMVDAHMVLEYDQKNESRRIYWGKKNRKGPMGELFYKIENGSILFSENNNEVSKQEINFSDEFTFFIQGYLKKVKSSEELDKMIKKDLNSVAEKLFEKFENDGYSYMTNLLPAVYHVISKYNKD
jgi:predicted ATP-dependent serine protease